MSADAAIDVTGITKRFGDHTVVDGIDLRVRRGEIFGFLGPNGSGKTTFLRMLCGLLRPDAGTGQCLGFDVLRESDRIKRQVGYMTQRFSYYEDLNLSENLDFVARVYNVPERRRVVRETLEKLGLWGRRRQLAGELSGGWKQRLALAASMLHRPRLLLLDEPTAGVDPKARRDFWEEIHQLAAEGITVLVTTHYMDEAERCHRVGYLAYGRLLASGTVEEVVRAAGLCTWEARGANLAALARELREHPAVAQAVLFGGALHVSGHDEQALEAAVRQFDRPGRQWRRVESGLEDAFISLMREVPDNIA